MKCGSKIENYEPPDKRKTPALSLDTLSGYRFEIEPIHKDAFIQSKLKLVSRLRLRRSINGLSSFHNRHSKSINIDSVAEYIKEKLCDIGYDDDVNFHSYTQDGYTLKNVICEKPGSINKYIFLTAHYDTILKENLEDIKPRAPGANDNASGVASLLEILRIIKDIDLQKNIKFAFFSGEEQGLWGSTHYARFVKDANLDLDVLINMDMCSETGWLSTNNTTNVDIDNGQTGIVETNNQESIKFGSKMKNIAELYTTLKVDFDPIDASDYMPFEARNYVCIGAYDGSAVRQNPHYHSSTDVPSNLNIPFLTSVTRMVLAFVLNEASAKIK
jgi:hypothetical protein